jgi:hypothetical protein
MITLRNTGVDIASAIDEFSSQFRKFLEKFGDKTSPGRQPIGAEIVRAAQEAWSKPALLNMQASREETAALVRAAYRRVAHAILAADKAPGKLKMPGEFPAQHGDRVKVPKKVLGPDSSTEESSVVGPKKPKTQQGRPKGKLPETSLGEHSDSRDPGSFGAPKPPETGSYGKPSAKGLSWTPTDLGPESQSKNNPTTSHWDEIARRAPEMIQSKPGKGLTPALQERRKKAVSALASLGVAPAAPSHPVGFWLRAAVIRAKEGAFPEAELWAARDAGLDRARLPSDLAGVVHTALGAL